MTVVLRFIDTETTAVRKVLTAESASTEIDRDFARKRRARSMTGPEPITRCGASRVP